MQRFDIGATQLLSDDNNQSDDDFSSTDSSDPDYIPSQSEEDEDEFDQHLAEFQSALDDRTPRRTLQNNEWALRAFSRWRMEEAPKQDRGVKIPKKFEEIPISRYNYVLSRFVMEAKDITGELYKSTTLYQIVAGLNRVIKDKYAEEDYDLLRTPRFRRFTQVLDGVMKARQEKEDPRTRKVSTFKEDDYDKLWAVLGNENDPDLLLTTLIYLAAKVFSLRAGDELRRITMKNFEIMNGTVPDHKDLILIR